MPKWRSHGPSANLSQIVTRTADRPKEVLDYFLSTFCNNFNCMTGYCTTHCECFFKKKLKRSP